MLTTLQVFLPSFFSFVFYLLFLAATLVRDTDLEFIGSPLFPPLCIFCIVQPNFFLQFFLVCVCVCVCVCVSVYMYVCVQYYVVSLVYVSGSWCRSGPWLPPWNVPIIILI